MSDSHIDHEEGVGSQVLGQLQQLVVAQSVGDLVAPVAVEVPRALLDGPDGLLPLEAVRGAVGVGPLDVAAAGEAHEARMEVGQHLSQIFAATVGTILERRRKKAHHIQVEHTFDRAPQHQPTLGLIARGHDGCRQLLPFPRGADVDGRLAQPPAAGILQFCRDDTLEGVFGAEPEGKGVLPALDDIHTPVAFVAHSAAGRFDVHAQSSPLNRIQHVVSAQADCGIAGGTPGQGTVHVLLERAVAHQFGVQTAVAGVVDFFVEDTIVVLGHLLASILEIKVDLHLSLSRQGTQH